MVLNMWPCSVYSCVTVLAISFYWMFCTLQKYFSHPSKCSNLLVFNPSYKTKTKTSNRLETTNSKPPGPIIMICQSETESINQTIFIRLFFWQLVGTKPPQHMVQKCSVKTILLSQTNMFWLFFIQFWFARSHIEYH